MIYSSFFSFCRINKIDIGTNKINNSLFFLLKFEENINGKILIVKTIKFAEKLPTNENI